MKVAQNDETISDTQPVCPPHPPNLSNSQLSPPPAPLPGNTKPREYFPGCFPPFTGITSYRVRTRLALLVDLLCTCLLCIYCFLPPLLFGRPRDDADAPVVDYVTDDPSLLPEQPGKPPL